MDDKQTTVGCKTCGGTGELGHDDPEWQMQCSTFPPCPACQGSGKRPINYGDLSKLFWTGFDGAWALVDVPIDFERGRKLLAEALGKLERGIP